MSTDAPTPYAFDPELAPLVALLPEADITDPVAARDAIAAFAAAGGFEATIDRSGLTISDHLVSVSNGRTSWSGCTARTGRPSRGPACSISTVGAS